MLGFFLFILRFVLHFICIAVFFFFDLGGCGPTRLFMRFVEHFVSGAWWGVRGAWRRVGAAGGVPCILPSPFPFPRPAFLVSCVSTLWCIILFYSFLVLFHLSPFTFAFDYFFLSISFIIILFLFFLFTKFSPCRASSDSVLFRFYSILFYSSLILSYLSRKSILPVIVIVHIFFHCSILFYVLIPTSFPRAVPVPCLFPISIRYSIPTRASLARCVWLPRLSTARSTGSDSMPACLPERVPSQPTRPNVPFPDYPLPERPLPAYPPERPLPSLPPSVRFPIRQREGGRDHARESRRPSSLTRGPYGMRVTRMGGVGGSSARRGQRVGR